MNNYNVNELIKQITKLSTNDNDKIIIAIGAPAKDHWHKITKFKWTCLRRNNIASFVIEEINYAKGNDIINTIGDLKRKGREMIEEFEDVYDCNHQYELFEADVEFGLNQANPHDIHYVDGWEHIEKRGNQIIIYVPFSVVDIDD